MAIHVKLDRKGTPQPVDSVQIIIHGEGGGETIYTLRESFGALEINKVEHSSKGERGIQVHPQYNNQITVR